MDKIQNILKSDKFKSVVAIIGAIIMVYTPEHIDRIVETLLLAMGIQPWILKNKSE